MKAILVAIGANLPAADGTPPIETCRRAATALAEISGLRVDAVSQWYATAPVPPSGQPDYINGVALLAGTIEPAALLAELHAIEQRAGRTRGAVNAARTLDLDIIAMDDLIRAAPDPVLPHPRAHLRAFVLVPLAEIAPGWIHPVLRRRVGSLIGDLDPGQQIRRLGP